MSELHVIASPEAQAAMSGQDTAALARKLEAQWQEAKRWWAPVRLKARKAREYYHMLQWTETQRASLKRQGRPAIVINLIGKAVDNITGRERATRYDWKASPVGQNDVMSSAAMTHGLKGIARQTEAKYRISESFEDAVLGPMGWGEVGYDDSDPEQSPEIVDRVDPEEMYFDPHSRKMDLSDAKYLIRRRIVDVEDAIGIAPHLEDQLRALAAGTLDGDQLDDLDLIEGDYDNRPDPDEHRGTHEPFGDDGEHNGRSRVALREHQWWVREDVEWLEMPDGTRHYLEDLDHDTYYQLMMNGAQEASGRRRCFYQAIVCGPLVLYHGKFAIDFGRYTYVGLFAKRDRQGRPYGLVERAIPCQEEVNVARSKLNESLRSRHLIIQAGTTTLTDQELTERLERGNFVLRVESAAGVVLGSDKADVQAWLELMREAKGEIDAVFGNNEAAYGDKSQEISGVAQQVRIQQQAQNLGGIFDNLRYFRKQIGEMLLVILQKHTSPQKLMRVIGASVVRGTPPVRLGPNGAPVASPPADLSWLGQVVAGPIYQNRFDVELTDQAESATERQAEMQTRIELLGMVPDGLKAAMLPDTLRATDWDGAEAIASKVEEAQQHSGEPPPPQKTIRDIGSVAYKDLEPEYRPAFLAQFGMHVAPLPAQQAGPSPDKVLDSQTKIATAHIKHAHDARQGSIERTHDELMAQQATQGAAALAAQSHDHQLAQQAFSAQQEPEPGQGGMQ